MLPAPLIARMLAGERNTLQFYDTVTIVFADFVGFTRACAADSSMIRHLISLFNAFDAATDAAGVEKLKTVGDAYVAVAGCPAPNPKQADCAADLALHLLAIVRRYNALRSTDCQIRVGAHTGGVWGGIIGTKRVAMDIWGDAVNVAARMESTGMAGAVQVTQDTYRRLQAWSSGFVPRHVAQGRECAGKGEMDTWFCVPPPTVLNDLRFRGFLSANKQTDEFEQQFAARFFGY